MISAILTLRRLYFNSRETSASDLVRVRRAECQSAVYVERALNDSTSQVSGTTEKQGGDKAPH